MANAKPAPCRRSISALVSAGVIDCPASDEWRGDGLIYDRECRIPIRVRESGRFPSSPAKRGIPRRLAPRDDEKGRAAYLSIIQRYEYCSAVTRAVCLLTAPAPWPPSVFSK